MKRMKFTLGIALSALFLGVSLNSDAADYPFDIVTHVVIYPSPYYFNSYEGVAMESGIIGAGTGWPRWEYPFADVDAGVITPHKSAWPGWSPSGIIDIWYDKYDTREIMYSGDTIYKKRTTSGDLYIRGRSIYYNIDTLATPRTISSSTSSSHIERLRYIQYIGVALQFKDGNDKMPFVKRTIHYSSGATDLYFEDNLMIPSEPEYWYDYDDRTGWLPYFLHNPYYYNDTWEVIGRNPRPLFTDGEGVAIYAFTSDISALMEKYIIKDILYEISVGDVISYINGSGQSGQSGYGSTTISRSVTFDYNDSGLSVYPLFYSGMQYWVPSHTDLEFAVKGDEEIVVTIDPAVGAYGPNKAYVKKDAGSEGVWNVSIPQITQNMTVKIGYASNTAGATGNALAPVTDFAYASSGLLHVSASAPSTLSIYNITGQLVKQTKVTGNLTMGLKKGLYIVKLNGKAYKVLL